MERHLLQPTIKIICQYVKRFEENTNAFETDKAISKLIGAFPLNTSVDEILLKVAAIDRLYSTNVYAIYLMAQHILELNIDANLSEHDPEIVMRIAELQIQGKIRHFYSFATKYCSWHNQNSYPIYDSYVDKLLRAYRKRDSFAEYSNEELYDYPCFRKIIQKFQSFYELEQFSLRDLDKFLWLYGKEYSVGVSN